MTERKDFFIELDKKIHEVTETASLEEFEDGYRSSGLFTTTVEGGGPALYETGFFDLWEDYPLLEVMLTPQFPVKEECVPEVEKLTKNFNFTLPLGHMGVHYETGRLFYRYVFSPDMEKNAEDLAEQTMEIYRRMAMIFGGVYDLFERLASGETTYAEEEEKNENLRQ